MSNFNQRTETADALINTLKEYFWNKLSTSHIHYEYGYETHIDLNVKSSLRLRQSPTAKHIRFAPDFLVFNKKNSDIDFLLEYKVTKTPRYTFRENQWNFGQIEADAFDNYRNLLSAGINVAIVIFCPYYERPLLCGIPSSDWLYSNRQRTFNSQGSGTDFYNIDLRNITTFEEFMDRYLNTPISLSKKLLTPEFYNALKTNPVLQTNHSNKSLYNKPEYATAFNWLKDYISK